MQGIYFHIPYCLSNADTAIFTPWAAAPAVPQEYVDALLRELAACAGASGRAGHLYFGGGTPSLLRPAQAARLIDAVRPAAGEITLEANRKR